jgi:hypothetical protein
LSQRFDNSLILQINPSIRLGIALASVHLGAAAAVAAVALPWGVYVLLWTVVGASLVRNLRLHASRQAATAATAVLLEADEELSLRFGASPEWQTCHVVSRALHRWVVLLRVRCPPPRRTLNLVICADAVEASAFRRLRARLRLRRAAA